ncbi:hypothetical protein SCG7086_BS_00100 [Chlamydiales bacterium SCGC AG-110-P3]|nr:hypothetical protein SCG7086_BS_00100 [Chlamydiales bacterium SCGC AG-110-P3]
MTAKNFFCLGSNTGSDSIGRNTEEFLTGLLRAIGNLVIVFDLEGRIVYTHSLPEAINGVDSASLTGKMVEELVPLGREEEIKTYFKRALDEPNNDRLSTFLVSTEDTNIPVLISAAPMIDSTGCKTGIIFFAQNHQQQRLLEAQLVQAQKLEAIGQLAAGVAHEINTPMQYIGDNIEFLRTGFTDLVSLIHRAEDVMKLSSETTCTEDIATYDKLKLDIDLDYMIEETPKALEQTREGVASVTKIIRSLKAFSHPGSESMELHDLNQVIQDAITVAKNEWKYVADVNVDFDTSLGLVPCHLGELNQVLLNMIVNAAHAVTNGIAERGENKGIIKLVTLRTDSSVKIIIEDNGTGIPEELRSKIYDPFFTTKEVGKGTGQGLAIAHRIITEKHRGKIALSSQPGFTQFTIELPLQQPTAGDDV